MRQEPTGCLLGGRTRRSQVSGWGGERGASCHLSKLAPARPRPAARLRLPRQLWPCPPGPAPWGLPRQFSSVCVRSPPSFGALGPHPLPGAAAREPPPRHPVPPCALLLGVSALAPPGPLVIPWVPPDPHFCTHFPLRRVSISGLSPYQLFFILKGSPLLPSSGFLTPPFPLGPSLFLIWREKCPDLGVGSQARLLGPVRAGVPGKTGAGSGASGPDLIRSRLVPLWVSWRCSRVGSQAKRTEPLILRVHDDFAPFVDSVFPLIRRGVNQDPAGSQLMQLLPFLERRRDGWGVSTASS